tara:strand:+ start:67 stop:450 length:384 start_codon:yes stop_codon:yes gene_type:complete
MKSLITEEEKLRIRSMHINEKFSLLKEDEGFFDLLQIAPETIAPVDVTQQVSTCAAAPELKTLEDEGKFRTWVKTTYANNAVSGIKLSDPRWKNPPTKFCNNALGKLWKSIEPTTKQTYGQLYITKK